MANAPSEPSIRMTADDFAGWDDGSDQRYELIHGRIVAMAPGSPAHASIAANLVRALGRRLSLTCRLLSEAGLRLPDRDDVFLVPDVMASCRPHALGPASFDAPELIAEILSPSTRDHDMTFKAEAYRAVSSARHILLIGQDRPAVSHFYRSEPGPWTVIDIVSIGSSLSLAAFGIDLPFEELYAGITFEEAGDGEHGT